MLLTSLLPYIAFTHIVGNFITQNNPSLTAALANGAYESNNQAPNPITNWPPYEIYAPYQMDLNQTGGNEISYNVTGLSRNETIYVGPGLKNDFRLVNAYTWEGGRGYRCDFWRSVGAIVPE